MSLKSLNVSLRACKCESNEFKCESNGSKWESKESRLESKESKCESMEHLQKTKRICWKIQPVRANCNPQAKFLSRNNVNIVSSH